MVFYDTNSRLQLASEHADRLATEMRRSRALTPDEAGYPRWGRLAALWFERVTQLRRERDGHVPAFDA